MRDNQDSQSVSAGVSAALPSAGAPKRSFFRTTLPVLVLVNTIGILFLAGMFGALLLVKPDPKESKGQDVAQSAAKLSAASQGAQDAQNDEAVSLDQAQNYFYQGRYDQALRQYQLLWEPLHGDPQRAHVADFLMLRQGQCLKASGKDARSRELLQGVADSRCAIVRGMANYLLATCEAQDGLHMQARKRAYAAIGALGSLQKPSPLTLDCDFLIARCLTRSVNALCNRDNCNARTADQPRDPFKDMDEASLEKLLSDGLLSQEKSALGPRVTKADGSDGVRTFGASCCSAPLEELMARIGAEAGMDVQWEGVSQQGRRRGVTLCLEHVSEQRLCEVACGTVGLMARFTGKEIIIRDPQVYDSTASQRDLLCTEAISVWRRAFLKAPADAKLAEGHFSLGCLHQCAGDPVTATAEFRRAVADYPRTDWAPQSLMESALIKISLRDYAGARGDLVDLLDSYPNYQMIDEAYLNLGTVAMKSGRPDEGCRAFLRLYYLNLSVASRCQACFGAGKCYFGKGSYKDAVKWLDQYVSSAASPQPASPSSGGSGTPSSVGGSHVDVVFNAGSLQEAYEMLGKSYACLGDSDKALTAYRAALAIDGTTDQRTQTALELATLLIDAQEFVPAISVLGLAEDEQLSDAQAFEHLMLNSRLMRRAALPEQAANLLRNKIESIGDPQLRARASVELARCRSEAGDAQEARTLLMGAIPLMDSSPDAWQASCDLAQACFKAGRCDQAITVAKGLLKVACGQEVQSQARSILADAYLSKGDFKSAADVLAAGPARGPSTQPAPLALVAQPFGAVPSVPGDGGQVSNAQPGKAVPPGKGVAQ